MQIIEMHIGDGAASCVDPLDRGLHYGDGLFETLRADNGRLPFLAWHEERLKEGCRRLGLESPETFSESARALARRHPDAVIKFLLTAGPGRRGYRRTRTRPGSYWFVFPLPQQDSGMSGIHVRWCRHRLSFQPALAGIKHLNRLDQVLARAEWEDEGIAEGILCDPNHRPVEGVQSNLFWAVAGRLYTPALDHCGVAGVLRRAVLAWAEQAGIEVRTGHYACEDLLEAEEVFLTNSIRGIQPVCRLEDRRWPIGPLARYFSRRLADLRAGREELPP